MLERIKTIAEKIKEIPDEVPIRVISHFDSDGIASAAIFSKALQRLKKRFSVQIVKVLEREYIDSIAENCSLILLDLGSGSLSYLKKKRNREIIIIDHHEIDEKDDIKENISIVNGKAKKTQKGGKKHIF